MAFESPPDDESNSDHGSIDSVPDSNIKLTRREALIAATAAGVAQAVGAGQVLANEDGIRVDLEQFEDGEDVYEQFGDGSISRFALGNGMEISVDLNGVSDDELQLEGYFSVNGSADNRFAQDVRDITGSNVEITFDSPDVWDENAGDAQEEGFDPTTDDFNLEWLDAIEDDYANLNAPSEVESEDDLVQTTSCTLTFEALSDGAEVHETQEVTFDLHVGHPMGFGKFFGESFGKDHIEDWQSSPDWG